MKISFWGSSLVSAYWNGAATYYRGILRGLAELGNDITFYEPDAYQRQEHRDIEDPEWARVVVYDPVDLRTLSRHLRKAAESDIVVKASGIGVLDEYLEERVAALPESVYKVFWDVDAPATLQALAADSSLPFHGLLPRFDVVLTYGGGDKVVSGYRGAGARKCLPVYNAFDPDFHFPVKPEERFACDLSFLGNRLPDREARVDEFLIKAAATSPNKRFVLGGSGWSDKPRPKNLSYVGHVYTTEHNAFYSSARVVLNVARDSMAQYGFSPATRVFEAAGAAACLISDEWDGIDYFLKPGEEILVAASGEAVAHLLAEITTERARSIGEAARRRVLKEHTYRDRAALVHALLQEESEKLLSRPPMVPV